MAGKKDSKNDKVTRPEAQRRSNDLSNVVIGTWLFLLYVVTIVVSILMLSSYQIQSRMQFVEINGASFSIWRLNELSEAYALEQKALKLQEETLDQNRQELKGMRARIRDLDKQYTPVFDGLKRDIEKFKNAYEAGVTNFSFASLDKPTSSVKVLFQNVESQIDPDTLSGDLKTNYDDIKQRHLKGDELFQKISLIKIRANTISAKTNAIQDSLIETAERLKLGIYKIISSDERYGTELDAEAKGRLQDAVSEFTSLKNIFWNIPHKLAIMPTEILVLFLVLAMGILGSTIFITQLFFRRDKHQQKFDEELNIVFFLSRPWFGAITALSIFVLAKAGVLFLTDPPTQSSRATLSPFFISFIAIISGLFSEQAIQSIKKAAEDWFRNQNTFSDRWGIGLQPALEKSGRDIAQFSEVMGVPVDTVKDWFDEKKPVATEMQENLSAWLETPARLLFTDMPPKPVSKDDRPETPQE
ncbi:MAG: hypothetical protein AAF423_10350 [Pseudomonadota bacterium]